MPLRALKAKGKKVKDLYPAPARDAEGHTLRVGDHVQFDLKHHELRSGRIAASENAWVKIDGAAYRALIIVGDDGKNYTFSAEHTHLAKKKKRKKTAAKSTVAKRRLH